MSRAVLAVVAALLLVPAAAAATALPGGRAIVVTTSVAPDTHLFADPVVARVDVVVDPRQIDPDQIRIRLRFAPYETVGSVEESRRARGALVHLRYTATLRCLHVRCLAPRRASVLGELESGRAERHSFHFAPAEVLDGRRVLLRRQFPVVEVVSRINTAKVAEASATPFAGIDTSGGEYVASIAPPPPTFRLDPTVLAALALGAASLLFLFPAALGGRFLYARWRAARRPPPLSPLERALALVEWTVRRDDGEEDRRKALEVLADVLEDGGARPLADATRELAWAEEAPGRERAGELADRARSTLPGGGNGRAA